MQHLPDAPGTVSKILWHFTGGPRWDAKKKCQSRYRKKPATAYDALHSILKMRTLRLGQYHEHVKARYFVRVTDTKTKELKRESREVDFESTSVCCLADIPIAHLAYHARRYGKFAIGFHRKAVVRHKFSPVFYALSEAQPMLSLRRCFSGLESINDDAESQSSDVSSFARGAKCEKRHEIEDDSGELWDFESAFDSIAKTASSAQDELRNSLAFVKTFSQSEFSTVYCEREWRSTQEFVFDLDDVAMIVLPRLGDPSFFNTFLKEKRPRLPRSIPIVPWEDLIEH